MKMDDELMAILEDMNMLKFITSSSAYYDARHQIADAIATLTRRVARLEKRVANHLANSGAHNI